MLSKIETIKLFAKSLAQDFVDHQCQKSAAALTYMTLFAIIPLMTVLYSVFSVIPAFNGVAQQLQQLIFSHFVPQTGSTIQEYLVDFSQQARSLSGAGVAMLVVTAYLMLINIEKTFNTIWGVAKGRRGLSSFLLYWAVLSIGPLLLGAGLGMSTYLLSLKIFFAEYDAFGLTNFVFKSLPMILSTAAFTLLFVAVPNCRVPFRYALVSGLLTAVSFELVKNVFSTIVAYSSFDAVYGAFAVVPLFLLWVNLAWVIVLTGAILVRVLAEKRYSLRDYGTKASMMDALNCLNLFVTRSYKGQPVADVDCYKLGVGVVHWQQIRSALVECGWVVETNDGAYVLCRDLEQVSLWDLALALGLDFNQLDYDAHHSEMDVYGYRELAMTLQGQSKEQLKMSLKDLFNKNISLKG